MIAKARHYDRMGHLGLRLLIAGFLFQLVGNLLQLPWVIVALRLSSAPPPVDA